MAVNKNTKVKVTNNMPNGALGFELANGKKRVLRKPETFTTVTPEDVWHIFNTCKTIQKGYLYIDNKDMRVELGLEEDDEVDVNSLSRKELKEIVSQSDIEELKEILDSDLSNGTKEKIVILAREEYKENGFDAKKMKLIERETGLPVAENDGSEVAEVNDVKEQKKVKRKTTTKK